MESEVEKLHTGDNPWHLDRAEIWQPTILHNKAYLLRLRMTLMQNSHEQLCSTILTELTSEPSLESLNRICNLDSCPCNRLRGESVKSARLVSPIKIF